MNDMIKFRGLRLVEENKEIVIYYNGKQYHVYEDDNNSEIHFLKLNEQPTNREDKE